VKWSVALLSLALTGCERELPVLLYHAVGCGTASSRDVPVEQFVGELDAAAKAGVTFVPVSELFDPAAKLPPNAAALTFDDGPECIYTNAFPVLKARHIPFALYLPAAWVEGPHVQDAKGVQWTTLTAAEVKAMLASGILELGAHGLNHAELRKVSAAEAQTEIAESRQRLAALFGEAPRTFAYPYGSYDRGDVALVKDAGYVGAFSVAAGSGGRYGYRRHSIHAGVGPDWFLDQLHPRNVLTLLAHD
jgi:peptidoglycan/xylan/chitin deacetylase (PgdA/CDA1 family)